MCLDIPIKEYVFKKIKKKKKKVLSPCIEPSANFGVACKVPSFADSEGLLIASDDFLSCGNDIKNKVVSKHMWVVVPYEPTHNNCFYSFVRKMNCREGKR